MPAALEFYRMSKHRAAGGDAIQQFAGNSSPGPGDDAHMSGYPGAGNAIAIARMSA
jgi:hypothetical protein